MSILKQRVPMANIEGSKAYITTEWLKDLNAALVTAGSTATAVVEAPTVTVSASDFAALVARVKKLEGGYQA